ncbi:MAG: GNAT family N-acetyltransferase [Deltaproteobacteria bacterium]|nr:GNAT family N-acetyltransferase [Deltaproteobacteria bacterium]
MTTHETPIRLELAVVEQMRDIARDEWNALLAADDSPFLEWEWLRAMEDSKSAARKTGWAPYHLIVRSVPDGRVVAACPTYLKSHSMGEFIFDHGWADAAERAGIRYFPKLLVGVPFTPHTGRRFLVAPQFDRGALIALLARALAELCKDNGLSSVHVNFCAVEEAEVLKGIGYLERLGYQYHWRNDGFANFDDYLSRLKSKRRYAVRHERAALEEQGVSIRVHGGDEISDAMFGPMFKIYLSTIQKLYWGRQYLTRDFFELLRASFRRHLRFVCAYRGRELIAGTINLEKAGVFYGRYWGCFTELPFLHFNVCYYAAIEHCIQRGVTRFEPGAGGEYKWLRGFDPALTRSMHFVANSGLRKAIANFLLRERREVEAWIAEGNDRSQLKPVPPSNVEGE